MEISSNGNLKLTADQVLLFEMIAQKYTNREGKSTYYLPSALVQIEGNRFRLLDLETATEEELNKVGLSN